MNPLTVRNVTLKQTPFFNPDGTATTATVLTFAIGPHGPFTVTWNPPQPPPTASDVITAVQTRLQELEAIATGINNLNLTIAA